MNLGKAKRLQRAREDLAAELAAYKAVEGREDALALRSTLRSALGQLTSLYEDDELWAVARSTVEEARFDEIVGRLNSFPETVPPLFDLFGYRTPPPPPAEQLVREAVTLVQRIDGENPLVSEVDEARAALGALLERTLPLTSEELAPPSWVLARAAAETLPAIEAGTTVAVAVAGGAIATVVTTAVLGAVTGGAGALAGVLIIGGVRRWKRKQAAHQFDADLEQYQEELAINLLPAVQAAVLYHLDVIADLIEKSDRDCDVLTQIDLKDHSDEILEIARRFAMSTQHLRAQATQASLKGNIGPGQFLAALGDLYTAVTAVQRALSEQPPMDWSRLNELVAERSRLGAIRLILA